MLLWIILWVLAGLTGLIALAALLLYLARVAIRVRYADRAWSVVLTVFRFHRTL